MKIIAICTLASALLWTTPAIAKDHEAQFKSVEAKHFPRAEGVELSPAFSDYLYAELRAELTKAKCAYRIRRWNAQPQGRCKCLTAQQSAKSDGYSRPRESVSTMG